MKKIEKLLEMNLSGNEKISFGLIGPAAMGKSEIVKGVADKLNRKVIEIRPGNLYISDFIGLPKETNKLLNGEKYSVTDYAINKWLFDCLLNPDAILFIEEISNSKEDVLGSLYELLLERQIAGIKLPDGINIVFAGNRSEDSFGIATDLPPTIYTRTCIVNLTEKDIDANSWLDWANQNQVDKVIIDFIKIFPTKLVSEKIDNVSYTTPRTWVLLSKNIQNLKQSVDENSSEFLELLEILIKSHINNCYVEFFEFYKNNKNLKKLDSIEYIKSPNLLSYESDTFLLIAEELVLFLSQNIEKLIVEKNKLINNFFKKMIKKRNEFPILLNLINRQIKANKINDIFKIILNYDKDLFFLIQDYATSLAEKGAVDAEF